MFYIIGGIALLIVLFIWWRYTSVARGAVQRDQGILEILKPIDDKLGKGESVTLKEIEELASAPQVRPMLYEMLRHYEVLDLFPETFKSQIEQGKAELAYWMMHPNELQDAPEKIELVEALERNIENKKATFFVYKYKMASKHWAGEDWILGVVGPYREIDKPHSGLTGAFSRCNDKYGQIEPSELVDWFIGMVQTKSST